MIKKRFGKCLFLVVYVLFSLLGLVAQISITGTPTITQTAIAATATPRTTVSQAGFAATVGSVDSPVNRDAHGDNLATIHSAVDSPVATFTLMILHVPPRAKGVVYIQNDSANDQALVSDTADGFATFTIAHYSIEKL